MYVVKVRVIPNPEEVVHNWRSVDFKNIVIGNNCDENSSHFKSVSLSILQERVSDNLVEICNIIHLYLSSMSTQNTLILFLDFLDISGLPLNINYQLWMGFDDNIYTVICNDPLTNINEKLLRDLIFYKN